MVQRVLGAKDEWHARMGVVGAGYLRIITPLFFVLPGIIAFKLFPNLPAAGHGVPGAGEGADPDRPARADPRRHGGGADEQRVVGAQQRLDARDDGPVRQAHPPAGERNASWCASAGCSGVVILIVSMLIGYYYSLQGESLYVQLQRIFFFIAPPFAVIFLVGLLWRRATATAAVWTIGLGFAFTAFLVFYAFRHIAWLSRTRPTSTRRSSRGCSA